MVSLNVLQEVVEFGHGSLVSEKWWETYLPASLSGEKCNVVTTCFPIQEKRWGLCCVVVMHSNIQCSS